MISALIVAAVIIAALIIMKSGDGGFEKAVLIVAAAVVIVIGGAALSTAAASSPVFLAVIAAFAVGAVIAIIKDSGGNKEYRKATAESREFEPSGKSEAELLKSLKGIKKGSTIPFGRYKWKVLKTYKGEALIMTEKIVEARPFHTSAYGAEWGDCTLRKYLNGPFLKDNFGEGEKKLIVPSVAFCLNDTEEGEVPYVAAGSKDSVFLLSRAELNEYLKGEELIGYFGGKRFDWWLRDTGITTAFAVNRFLESMPVEIEQVICVASNCGVRPAMWIRIK